MSTLRHFDFDTFDHESGRPGAASPATAEPTKSMPVNQRLYLARDVWSWQDLRDYVTYEIESRFGPFPRDAGRETGIFKSFHARWGADKARAIAEYAFEIQGGRWAGAPVSIWRFMRSSDDFFGGAIMARLEAYAERL